MSFGTSPFASFAWGAMGPAISAAFQSPESPATPQAAQAPFLQATGDYLLDGNSNLQNADPVDQEVAWRMREALGSLVGEPALGNGVLRVDRWTDDAPIRTHDEVRRALAPMVDRGVIKDLAIVVSPYTRNGTSVNAYAVTYKKTGRVIRR